MGCTVEMVPLNTRTVSVSLPAGPIKSPDPADSGNLHQTFLESASYLQFTKNFTFLWRERRLAQLPQDSWEIYLTSVQQLSLSKQSSHVAVKLNTNPIRSRTTDVRQGTERKICCVLSQVISIKNPNAHLVSLYHQDTMEYFYLRYKT